MYANNTGYPSSTEVLRPYLPTEWFTEEARTRGSAVHLAIECELKGLWSPRLKTEYQGYFDSWKRWADAMIDEVIILEERMIDKNEGYCGKADLVARLKGDPKTNNSVVDWKTATAASKSWSLQVASYQNLSIVDKGVLAIRGMSLRLRLNGKMPIVDEYTDLPSSFRVFLAALKVFKHFN